MDSLKLHTLFTAAGDTTHTGERAEETWRRTYQLGKGSFCTVWQEECISNPQPAPRLRAVKRSPRHQHVAWRRELDALIKFSPHRDYFVQCFGWFEDNNHLYISMEFIPHGTLQAQIHKRPLPEAESALVISQLAQALKFMHDAGYLHRDLKPLNILINRLGPDWHVKVADFGISKDTSAGGSTVANLGTPGYLAPEILSGTSGRYTAAVDIWSLGAISYCLITKRPPFENYSDLIKYAEGISQFPIKALGRTSYNGVQFIVETMTPVRERRLNIDQVISHAWLEVEEDLQQEDESDFWHTHSNKWEDTYSLAQIHSALPAPPALPSRRPVTALPDVTNLHERRKPLHSPSDTAVPQPPLSMAGDGSGKAIATVDHLKLHDGPQLDPSASHASRLLHPLQEYASIAPLYTIPDPQGCEQQAAGSLHAEDKLFPQSSESSESSLKHSKPQDLPKFRSRNTVSSISKAVLCAKDNRMDQVSASEQTAAGSKAAMLAYEKGGEAAMRFSDGYYPATMDMRKESSSHKSNHGVNLENYKKAKIRAWFYNRTDNVQNSTSTQPDIKEKETEYIPFQEAAHEQSSERVAKTDKNTGRHEVVGPSEETVSQSIWEPAVPNVGRNYIGTSEHPANLRVTIVRATDLRFSYVFSRGKMFAQLKINKKQIGRTGSVNSSRNPYWNESFDVSVSVHDVLQVVILSGNKQYTGSSYLIGSYFSLEASEGLRAVSIRDFGHPIHLRLSNDLTLSPTIKNKGYYYPIQ